MTFRLLVLTAVILPFLACAKRIDYDYYFKPDRSVSFEHKIKEFSGNSQLDVLWVIDDSSSMDPYQTAVIRNVNSFVDGFVQTPGLRWRMGLISTTLRRSPLIGLAPGNELEFSTPDAVNKFKTALGQLGRSGSADEQEFSPIMDALRTYPKWVRPNAYLAIIVVTDANEKSLLTTQQFIRDIEQVKGKLSNVLFYSFINPKDWCAPTDDIFPWAGSKFEEISKLLQGGAYKLCDPDFGKNIAGLGSDIAKQVVSPRILLKDKPIETTLRVLHRGKNVPGGPLERGGYWIYDVRSNSIVFNDMTFAPNENESVQVVYDVDQNF